MLITTLLLLKLKIKQNIKRKRRIRFIKLQKTYTKKHNQVGSIGSISSFAYKLYPGIDPSSDQNFKVLDSCTGCRSCEKICPANNIEIIDNKPTFKHNCDHCIACVHICPVMAIQWNREYKDTRSYRHPQITRNELIQFCGKDK